MTVENLIIIGSGPAAYTAALYTQEFQPLLFEGEVIGNNGPGGQLTTTTNVDNYPGFPDGIQGPELAFNMKEQILKTNNIRIVPETVISLKQENNGFVAETAQKAYFAKCVIIGTGAQSRRLFVPGTGNEEFWQKGVSSCAVCDGWVYKRKIVAVIGGGDSAMEETMYLSNIAAKVYLIHRRDEFRARKDLLKKVEDNPKVEVLRSYVLDSVGGDKVVRFAKFKDLKNDKIVELKIDGLFFGIGHDPNTFFFDKEKIRCENEYIVTDDSQKTSVDGIFACGDVQDYKYRQAVTAASSGCIAGLKAVEFLKNKQ